MNVENLGAKSVERILKDIRKYVDARSPAPQEILLSRDSYTKLRNLSKSDDLDFRGIRLVCR